MYMINKFVTYVIKRRIYPDLKDHLGKEEMSIIIGPRQAGKTTLMNILREELNIQGERTLYFNLDVEGDRKYFTSQRNFITKIELDIGKGKGYVFIDEIQRKENAGLYLKGIYDMKLPYKFIISGSGGVELKEKIKESMVGRKRMFHLSTVSFEEFVNFKTNYRYEDKLQAFFEIESDKTKSLFEEYMRFGGYPRVILEETVSGKSKVIGEIYEGYIEKDIGYLLGVENIEAFSSLVKIMASQIGSLVNMHELSSTLGISIITVKNYLWYLEHTYILQKVTPFFTNIRKEITKSPLFYFSDLGFRNFALGIFGQDTINIQDKGFLFENFVFNILKDHIEAPAKIHHWRTKDKAEVDFVVNAGREVIPIEAKYRELKSPQTTRSFQSFLSKYHPSIAYVVHLGAKSKEKTSDTNIYLLPYWKFLYEKLRPF